MFSLKGALQDVANAFTTVIKKIKGGAAVVATDVNNATSVIEKDEAEVGAVVDSAFPGTAAVVATIEELTPKVLGIVIAGADDIAGIDDANASATILALKGLLPDIKALGSTLATAPTVVAANTPPAAASTT